VYRLGVQDTLNGCIRETGVTVDANQQLPTIVLDAPGELNCEQSFILLNGEGSSNGPGFQLNWSTSNGQLGARPNPLRIRALEAGTYFLTIEDLNNGCELTDSVVIDRDARFINVLELETIDPACAGEVSGSVMVLGVEGGTPPYRFQVDGGLITDRMVYEDLPIGTYEFTVIDSSGCERSETFSISESELPQLSLGLDQTISLGDSIALDFTTNQPSWDTLIWSGQGPLPQPGVLPAYVSPTEGVRYELTLIDNNGCSVSDDIRIEVLNEINLYVPNAFSPNGDNNNDLFFPYGGPQIRQVNRFLIFDRWGNMVHEATNFQPGDPLAGWDGTFKGQALNTNVFVWRLELTLADGMVISRYGDVLLQR
jgi:gliding motility-associated-like protein